MNIYLSVELAVRELDSKLLLATIAASRGHQVIISEQNTIKRGLMSGVLDPGIFHDKSLTPNDNKIALHKSLIKNGFKITSIDEEGYLVGHGYDMFARNRYSEQMIEKASAVFGWGTEDVDVLKKFYPKYSSKIHKTGSARADLWKLFFSDYWNTPKMLPKKPYLLVSSSMETYMMKPFHDVVRFSSFAGYYKRDSQLLKNQLGDASEAYAITSAFIEAIKHLANKNIGYDIVLRPHPIEDIEAWKISLENIPNVHVIREGSITPWVNNAFAIMHNGCATALEATISGKPVVTYVPFKQKFGRKLPNELGHCVETLEDLLLKVNTLFEKRQLADQKNLDNPLPETVSKKIYLDKNELAAEKMIKLWESLGQDNFSKTSNMLKFEWFLKIVKFRSAIGAMLRKLFPAKFGQREDDWKFPSLNNNDIHERISRFKHVLKIDVELECKLLSDRTILIRRS